MNFRRGEIPQEKYNASFAITLDRFVRSQSSLSDLERLCPIRFSLLPQIRSNSEFAIYCFLVRGMEALGASAFSTASFVYVIHLFPDNVGAVLVRVKIAAGKG
jgi:hypothetical protein